MCVIRVCGALLYDLLEFWYKGFTVYTAKFVFSLALLVGELSCGRRIFFDLTTFALIAGLKWHVCTGLWCVLHNIARMRKMPVDEDDLDWEEDEDASLMKLNPIRETLGHYEKWALKNEHESPKTISRNLKNLMPRPLSDSVHWKTKEKLGDKLCFWFMNEGRKRPKSLVLVCMSARPLLFFSILASF